MTAVQVRPHISVAQLDPQDETLQGWVRKLKERNPHFAHAHDHGPGSWLGLYANDLLLSAIGYTWNADHSVLVEYVVCRPTRTGRIALTTIIALLRKMLTGRRIVWFTQNGNERMNKIFKSLGASPVATMWELQEITNG